MPAGPFTLQASNDATPWLGSEEGQTDAVFQIVGAFGAAGVITFEACVPGAEATPIPLGICAAATPGTYVTTATAPGLFKTFNNWAGGLKVRARVTTPITNPVQVYTASADEH